MTRLMRGWMIVLSAAVGVNAASAAEKLPNIVVILSDDLGWGSLGCYGANPELVQTPHCDRLAKEGRRFTNGNTTSSVCSPTRYSLLTGRYCWRTSLKTGVLGVTSPLHIESDRLNMASMLKKHGYTTAAIGKWHLGYGSNPTADYLTKLAPGPLEIGFDYHFAVPANHGDMTGVYVENHYVYGLRKGTIETVAKINSPAANDSNYKATYTKDDLESSTGKRAPYEIDAPRRVNERVMPVLSAKAVEWIAAQPDDKPFFLYYAPVAAHNPVTPSAELAGKSKAGPFGDWIHELDRSVGEVLAALDRKGVAENTLVIFSSDNGGVHRLNRPEIPQSQAIQAGLVVNGHWQGSKHDYWEGGFRVPFLVRWPGKVPASTVCDEMVSIADILATTAAIVGEVLPSASSSPAQKAAEDSYNVLPAFLGEKLSKPIRPDIVKHSSDGVFCVVEGNWKWIEGVAEKGDLKKAAAKKKAAGYKPALYDLAADPGETKNVIADHPDIARRLAERLEQYRSQGFSRPL